MVHKQASFCFQVFQKLASFVLSIYRFNQIILRHGDLVATQFT